MTKVLYTCYKCGHKTDNPIEERRSYPDGRYRVFFLCQKCNKR